MNEPNDGPTLETYLETRFNLLGVRVEKDIRHERELREASEQRLAAQLEKDNTEIRRRLDELNHAHVQAMENWRTSLPRELFDAWLVEHNKWRDGINATMTLTTGKETGQQEVIVERRALSSDTRANLAIFMSLVFGLAALITTVFLRP